MKKYIILALFLLISCGTDLGMDISSEELTSKVLEANNAIDSYKVDMTMKMSGEVSYGLDDMDLEMEITGTSYVDTPNKKIKSTTTITTELFGMKNEMVQDSYIVDGQLYTQSLGMWIKAELKGNFLEEHDSLDSNLQLLETAEIERLPDDSVDGDDFLVIKITPDIDHIKRQLGNYKSMFGEDEDYENLIQSFSEVIFINKKTFYIEKIILSFVLNLETPEAEEGSFNINVDSIHEFSEFNTKFDIELPPEAKDATDMGSLFNFGEESSNDGMGAVTGNIIDMAKS